MIKKGRMVREVVQDKHFQLMCCLVKDNDTLIRADILLQLERVNMEEWIMGCTLIWLLPFSM